MGVGWGEVGVGRESEKRKAGGAKRERVPVPVLGVERVRREVFLGKRVFGEGEGKLPVRTVLAVGEDGAD